MRVCQNCGRALQDWDRFCDKCGGAQVGLASHFEFAPTPTEPAPKVSIPRRFPNVPVKIFGLDRPVVALILITATGLVLRVFALTYLVPLDFRLESYARWQIAYYTLKIGISHGKMWDLGGVEYLWGPIPILIESFDLWLFNTTSILPFRYFILIIGTAMIPMCYLVGKTWYNAETGLLAGAMVSICPIMLFNSVVAMPEIFAAFFILVALFLHRNHKFYAGIALAIASLSRPELWLISLGIIAAFAIFERDETTTVAYACGWLLVMFPYFVHVYWVTGNPFYSVYWSLLGSMTQVFCPSGGCVPTTLLVRAVFFILLVASVAGLLALVHLRDRIKSYIIPVVFLGFLVYHGMLFALSSSSPPLFDRYFLFDAALGFILLAFFVSKMKKKRARVMAIAFIGLQVALLFVMIPMYTNLSFVTGAVGQSDIEASWNLADQLGARYQNGTVLCDMQVVTYRLVDHWGLTATDILGTIYMPKDSVQNGVIWLKRYNVTWLVVTDGRGESVLAFMKGASRNDTQLIQFTYTSGSWAIYRVDLKALG